jgi:uncharacterized phage-associated protein
VAYPAKAVANEFLRLAKEHGQPVSPMTLLKLVFFAHGWYLAATGRPLIKEQVEAWRYGPVIRVLYDEFKHFGNCPISDSAHDIIFDGKRLIAHEPNLQDSVSCESEGEYEDASKVIRWVWDKYRGFEAIKLSQLTHLADSPWKNVYKDGVRNIVIPNDVIRGYYKKLLEDK